MFRSCPDRVEYNGVSPSHKIYFFRVQFGSGQDIYGALQGRGAKNLAQQDSKNKQSEISKGRSNKLSYCYRKDKLILHNIIPTLSFLQIKEQLCKMIMLNKLLLPDFKTW